jgi:hypothetical protein
MIIQRERILCLGLFIGAVFLLNTAMAQAHMEQGQAIGFLTGLEHPWSGFDHILAMIAVGLWGAQLGNLFLTTAIHPNNSEGQRAIQVLSIKYKRMDSERSRRALWISIIALVISLVGIVVNAFGAEERYLCVADMATGFKFDSNTKKWQ